MIGSDMRRAISSAVVLALLGWAAAACGGSESPSGAPTRASADEFIELTQDTQHYMFEPFTPSQLLELSVVVVHGSVQTVREGRIHDPGGVLNHQIVVGLKPDEILKEDPARRGNLVYIELNRPDDVSADEMAQRLPRGTEVAVFASPGEDPGFPVRNPNAGREAGASIYLPFPQGLWMGSEEGFQSVLTSEEVSQGAWSGVDSWESLKAAAAPE